MRTPADECHRPNDAPASPPTFAATLHSEANPTDVAANIDRDLFHHLVGGAVRGSALGRAQQQEHGTITPGSDPGAPAIPGLKRKLVWTTIVAGIVFALWYVVYTYRLIALDDLAALLGIPRR